MTVYDLKPRFQARLRPVCQRLADLGVTANQVTLAAVGLSAAAGGFMALAPASRLPWLLLPAVLLLRMALNAVDGILAREHNMKSPLGALLNELGDVLSDAFLYLPFARLPAWPGTLVVILVLLAGLTEMTGLMGAVLGGERRYDGPMGKSDRAVVFGILGLAVGLDILPPPVPYYLLSALIPLLLITLWKRGHHAVKAAA
ncbi:MAG: CDP-alcohol phosphatidyltransferase family protein [Verrucomicrobia bacterium]|nr:CDP-alcohol phosphatidyltransferase family protein [Verrucomicrobiota bacterium]MCH8526585.1 CDP-alcohol phosphatidyltransferase family protein [Kiritimatiellia bacterium]